MITFVYAGRMLPTPAPTCRSDGYGGCLTPSPKPSKTPSSKPVVSKTPQLPLTGPQASTTDMAVLGFFLIALGALAVWYFRRSRKVADGD